MVSILESVLGDLSCTLNFGITVGFENFSSYVSGDDVLIGANTSKIIEGGAEPDTLTGDGCADDYARGGSPGINIFVLITGSCDSLLSDSDIITDFEDVDIA